MVNFRPQSLKEASKSKQHRGLYTCERIVKYCYNICCKKFLHIVTLVFYCILYIYMKRQRMRDKNSSLFML